MTLAAEAPDLDIFGSFKDPVFAFAHHRGFTHSFAGLIFVSALVVGCMYLIWLARGRKTSDPDLPPRWGLLFVFAYIAGLSHILLDYTNNYGVRPFWPLSEKWYSWDIVFIIEPALLLLLIGGLLAPSLWSRLSPQGQIERRRRLSAALALCGVLVLWGMRSSEHGRAVRAVLSQRYQNEAPLRGSAYPYWWNPYRWMGVAETKDSFAIVPLHTNRAKISDEDRLRLYPKPQETPVTLAAKNSEMGRVYLDWAKYPLTEVTVFDWGYSVRFRDLRYAYPERLSNNTLAATVDLDKNLNVIRESMGTRSRILRPQPTP
jgi:inner membrane protein